MEAPQADAVNEQKGTDDADHGEADMKAARDEHRSAMKRHRQAVKKIAGEHTLIDIEIVQDMLLTLSDDQLVELHTEAAAAAESAPMEVRVLLTKLIDTMDERQTKAQIAVATAAAEAAKGEVSESGFQFGKVRLTETNRWCFHEGSYGHNPEYGLQHKLLYDGADFFWISTSGEMMVPKEVSPSGSIGATHTAVLDNAGKKLVVTIVYGKSGKKETHVHSTGELYAKYVARGNKAHAQEVNYD